MNQSLIRAELKAIFTNRKILIPIIAVLFIPVLYAGMFLWAFWDPYERLSDLPVAIVNEDEGAEFEGEELLLGNELVDELKESKEFNFQFVSRTEAYEDLENRNYYMVVEIPEDFSENATTLLDDEPKKLELKYVPNESFNFLSAQIGDTAMKEIKAELQKNVTKTYAEAIFDQVDEMADGLGEASDGAKELNDGALELKDGSDELKENLMTLASKSLEFQEGVFLVDEGSGELVAGIESLNDGLGQLVAGHEQLLNGVQDVAGGTNDLAAGISTLQSGLTTVDEKMNEMSRGMQEAANGASQLSEAMPTLQEKTNLLASGATDVANGIAALQQELLAQEESMAMLVASLQQMLPEEQFNQIVAQLPTDTESAQLKQGLEELKMGSLQVAEGTKQLSSTVEQQLTPTIQQLSSGMSQLTEGQKQLTTGVHELSVGSTALQDGVSQLQAGEAELVAGSATFQQKLSEAYAGTEELLTGGKSLNDGLNQLTDGSVQLSDGANQLAEGSVTLADGTEKLTDGTTEMFEKLSEAAEEANEVDTSDATYDMMAEPVQVQNEGIHKVPNYGTGFAPYFMSLGLFVGALVLSVVFPFRDTVQMPKSGLQWFFSKFGLLISFGIIQSLFVDAILLVGLGIEVESIPLFILMTIATSLAYIAIVHMLVTILDNPGRFVAILILIIQLTASAGTFPLELIPTALQNVNALLPMTYSISALKAVISSGDYAFMWQNAIVLLAFTMIPAIMTATYLSVKYKKSYANYATEELGA